MNETLLKNMGFTIEGNLVYSKESKVTKDGHGYEYKDREVFCMSCSETLGRQEYYIPFPKLGWKYTVSSVFDKFKFCPYCGADMKKEVKEDVQ